MKINTEFASNAFSKTLEWAKPYGERQVDHHYKTMTQRFNENAIIALGAGILADLRQKRAACVGKGIVDQFDDRALDISAVTIKDGEGLSVRFENGDNILFVWSDEDDTTYFGAIPWKDEPPVDLVNELKDAVKAGISYSDLTPIVRKFADFSVIPDPGGEGVYSRRPAPLPAIISEIATSDLKHVSYADGMGYCWERRGDHGISNWDATGGHHKVATYAKQILSKIDIDSQVKINKAQQHLIALQANALDILFASSCAIALDYHLEKYMDGIKEIVTKSEEIGLSSELVFSHNDKDIDIYGQRFGDLELYSNYNLDAGTDGFATVISNENGKPRRVDVYLTSPWGKTFEEYFGCEMGDLVKERLTNEFVERVASELPVTTEIELVSELRTGRLPSKGLAFSYDIPTKTIELTSLAYETDYIHCLPLDVKSDLERLTAAINGDEDRWIMGFKQRLPNGDYKELETSEYIASRKPLAI
jgi:hypothetical protein